MKTSEAKFIVWRIASQSDIKYQKLAIACLSKGWSTWHEIADYVKQYKKYDDLTFRDIDHVHHIVRRAKEYLIYQ